MSLAIETYNSIEQANNALGSDGCFIGGGTLVMRTNWDIYAREFAYVISIILNRPVECVTLQVSNSISAHEKKYLLSQHQLYEVRAEL